MKASFAVKRFLRGVMSMSLLGIAGLAVAGLSPSLVAAFGAEGTEELAFSRPVAPTAVLQTQPVAANTPEAFVLANWEYTCQPVCNPSPPVCNPTPPPHNPCPPPPSPYGNVVNQDVLRALVDVNNGNSEAGQALLASRPSQTTALDIVAEVNTFLASTQLQAAANAVTGTTAAAKQEKAALQADATQVLNIFIAMIDPKTPAQIFQLSQQAQMVVNNAVTTAASASK